MNARMKPTGEVQNEEEHKLVPTNKRPLTMLERHFKVMAGIKSADPDAQFSAGEMYTACVERGSTKPRAFLDTFLFCTVGKATAGFWPWDAVKLSDVTKFMHTDSSKTFKNDGSVDTARITALTQHANSSGNITRRAHEAYVAEYQAAPNVPHSRLGKGANGGEWGGYWDGQQFTTTDAEGNKEVNASKYGRFFTDPEGIDSEVKTDVKHQREATQEKTRSSWCPSFRR